jgi:hypothetical protein
MASLDMPAHGAATATAAPAKPTYITWLTPALMTDGIVGKPAQRADDGRLRPYVRVPVHRAGACSMGGRRISAKWGLLAVWCHFAMTIFHYPTLLGFVASTLACRGD